jgi:hypothetical protein
LQNDAARQVLCKQGVDPARIEAEGDVPVEEGTAVVVESVPAPVSKQAKAKRPRSEEGIVRPWRWLTA